MQVGDLVRLSAYGKRLKSNKFIGREELGIIVGTFNTGFNIWWLEYRDNYHYWSKDPIHFRNELRYAK